MRLGLADVSSIGTTVAERIVAEREARGPYRDMADLSRRAGLDAEQLEALAAAGAFDGFGLERREALWLAGEAAQDREEYLAHVHFPIGSDGSMDVPENVYDSDAYEAILRECGFDQVRIEVVTDRTVTPFVELLERLSREAKDDRGPRRALAAELYRDSVKRGVEYVFVSARKPAV